MSIWSCEVYSSGSDFKKSHLILSKLQKANMGASVPWRTTGWLQSPGMPNRLLIWPTCLDVKGISISDYAKTPGQALWAWFWLWSGLQGSAWKVGLPKQVVSKDLGEFLHAFPTAIVAGFLSVRHKEQIKISLSNLWFSDTKSKNVSSRKEESHSPTHEHVGSSRANLWWRCGNCKLLLWKQNHYYCILLVSFSRLFPSFHLFLIFSRKFLEG